MEDYLYIPMIKINSLKRLYPILSAKLDDVNYSYNTLAYLSYYSTEEVGVSFEDFDWSLDTNTANIGFNQAQVLRGDFVTYNADNSIKEFVINAVPKMDIVFEDGTQTLVLDFLLKQFNIKVIEGSTNLELSSYESNISLKDIFIIDVALETDIPSDTTEPYTSIIGVESIERVGILETEDPNLEISIERVLRLDQPGDDYDNFIYYRYEIEIIDKFNELYSNEQTYIITFASYDKSIDGVRLEGKGASLTTQLTLNIIPQDVFRIDMNYYSSNEIFENQDGIFYNPNELPSTSIVAGKIGLLKLAVYPEYANADYIELTYSTANPFTLSLEQVAHVQAENFTDVNSNNVYDYGEPYVDSNGNNIYDTEGYTAIYPQGELIPNGIRLRLISNKDASGNYTYDGNLYARALISSAVSLSSQFTIIATAFTILDNGITIQGLTSTLILGVQPASEVTLSYDGQDNEGYIAVGTIQQTLIIGISKLEIEDESEIDLRYESAANQTITTHYIDSYKLPDADYITYYKYSILVEITNDDYTPIKLQAIVEKNIQ